MATQTFGKIVVNGTDAQVAFAAKVYAGFTGSPFVGDLEPHTFPIEFHTAQEMYDLGAIIPNTAKPGRKKFPLGDPAFGFTFPNRLCINSDVRPRDQAYALEHEPFHPIVAAKMTASKKAALQALVEPVAGGTRYQNRLSEVLCDAFVELFYGHSIEDAFYGDIANADLQKAWDILMKPTTNEPTVPVDPPVPLPLPDPQIADLQAQVDTLTAQLAEAEGKIAAARTALA